MRNGIQISHDLDAVILDESTTKFYCRFENQESKEFAVSSDCPKLSHSLFWLTLAIRFHAWCLCMKRLGDQTQVFVGSARSVVFCFLSPFVRKDALVLTDSWLYS
jgi:hypothetical protein